MNCLCIDVNDNTLKFYILNLKFDQGGWHHSVTHLHKINKTNKNNKIKFNQKQDVNMTLDWKKT